MTTYAYTRVSTAEQANGTSLADQAQRIAAANVARGQLGVTVVEDAGVSGSVPLLDRPAGRQMMEALQPGDTIIALKLDRMFRSASDALNIAEILKGRGVDLILLDLSTDPVNGSGMGKFVFTMLAAIAEMERNRIAERTQSGRAAKKAAGGATSAAPFGYVKVGVGKAAMLQEHPEQQRAIDTIKRGKAAGMSLRGIADLVKSMHPAVKVSHVTIGKVLDRLDTANKTA